MRHRQPAPCGCSRGTALRRAIGPAPRRTDAPRRAFAFEEPPMPGTPAGLTSAQAETLAAEGAVRLPGAVPTADADTMRDALWRRLQARHGVFPDRPETWKLAHPAQLTSKLEDFAAMASRQV